MNNIIKRYFEIKARDDNRPFVRLLSIAYQNDKITDDEALLFCSNNWKKMHGFKLEKYGKMDYRNKGKRYKGFLWNDKVSLVINEKIMRVMKDYVAHLDNKKRITLRGAAYQYYNVKEYGNGCIILEPRELAVPESISARTLEDMDRAVSNFKKGDVSPVIDLSDF